MLTEDAIAVDPHILDGTPVFEGTDVPVARLFEHLRDYGTVADFHHRFPAVSRHHVEIFLEQMRARFA